jgi:hypothetical protein
MPLEMSKEPEVTDVERVTLVFVCADVNLKNENTNTTNGITKGLLFANEAVFV